MKNLMPEVAKLLGVEIGEEFRIGNPCSDGRYKIDEFGYLLYTPHPGDEWDESQLYTINTLLSGLHQIIKLPYNPKVGRLYYAVENEGVYARTWDNDMSDFIYLKCGNCFRTKEEAEANADRIRKEIMGI